MELKPMAWLTGIGGVCGGAIAGLIGGPAAIPGGIKMGSACGIRVAVVNKGEQAVDAAAKKIGEAGNAVSTAAEATAKEINKLTDKASKVLEDIADIWSKLCLTGYAISLGLNGASEAMKNFQTASCKSTFESPNCFSISLTHISLNTTVMIMGALLAQRVYRMVRS